MSNYCYQPTSLRVTIQRSGVAWKWWICDWFGIVLKQGRAKSWTQARSESKIARSDLRKVQAWKTRIDPTDGAIPKHKRPQGKMPRGEA